MANMSPKEAPRLAGENEPFNQITTERFALAEEDWRAGGRQPDGLRQAYLDLLKKA